MPRRAALAPLLALAAPLGAAPAVARAETDRPADREPALAARAAARGAFLPHGEPPAPDAGGATAAMMTGWDAGRGAPVVGARAAVRAAGRVSVHGAARWDPTEDTLRPAAGVRVRVTPAGARTVAAVTVAYDAVSHEGEPALEVGVAVEHRAGRAALLAHVAYGEELDERQRHGEARAAALIPLGRRVHVGVDAVLRVDLDDGRPEGDELQDVLYEAAAGPTASVALGRASVFGWTGVTTLRLSGEPARRGPAAILGVGAAF